ncbi:MAG: MscL family protein [Candidatus Yanofskybacteria bacterium]|nr:MscL family protein [Candidatus Yanofskybacteria bacterium]
MTFFKFIREQGIIGLAVGFILGSAVTRVVSSLVGDIINPILGIALGRASALREASTSIGGATITWGNFVITLIDFLVVASVVFVLIKTLRLDPKKSE